MFAVTTCLPRSRAARTIAPAWLAGFLLPDVPSVLGFALHDVVLEVGILLALSAVLLLVVARRPVINRTLSALSAGVDAALVAGIVLLLAAAGGAFSLGGAIALLVVAADTALIGWLKFRALRMDAPVSVAA